MQLLDFSPPATPSPAQQRDALQKGLGRAVQWATTGVLAAESLLDACLQDQRFDRQCEANRGEWLWRLISLTGTGFQFREPLLNALRTVNEEQNAFQLCDLAMCFARSGDDEFRQQLYEFVRQRQIPDSPSLGENQLLSLDGERAFTFLAQLRGHSLATRDWEWDDEAVISEAIEDLGESRVREILSQSSEPETFRFAADWSKNQKPPGDPNSIRQSRIEKTQAITVSEVLNAIESEDNCNWLRGWGMQADESALEGVLERMWVESSPPVIVKLLRTFSNRPLPTFDSRLIELCNHGNEDVRRWALKAMEKNSHPLVREFALREIRKKTPGIPVIGLLIKNFEQGDEQRILDHVELADDLCERHWMLMDLIELLEENETADSSKLGQIVYFHTPCQNCRFYAVRLLFRHGHVPPWLAEECRTDADEDCRTLAEQSTLS